MRSAPIALLVVLLLAGCARPVEEAGERVGEVVEQLPRLGPEREPEAVRFLAWGDAGHGNPEQYATAEAARRVCEAEGCDLVLGLGDNVYPSGVNGTTDKQLRWKFEEPYRNLTVPFYMVLGNHDVVLNATAQVAYSNHSERWRMPARSYAFEEGPVAFFALDLTSLAAGVEDGGAELGAWLADEMNETDAAWRVVFAHFPYASNGKHGNATPLLRAWLEAHVCGKADLYLSGHDHDLQWLAEQPACQGTELIVSGAASDARPLSKRAVPAHFAHGNTTGFFWFEADEDGLTGRAYDAEGNVLFERVVTKEARAAAPSTPRPRSSAP